MCRLASGHSPPAGRHSSSANGTPDVVEPSTSGKAEFASGAQRHLLPRAARPETSERPAMRSRDRRGQPASRMHIECGGRHNGPILLQNPLPGVRGLWGSARFRRPDVAIRWKHQKHKVERVQVCSSAWISTTCSITLNQCVQCGEQRHHEHQFRQLRPHHRADAKQSASPAQAQ